MTNCTYTSNLTYWEGNEFNMDLILYLDWHGMLQVKSTRRMDGFKSAMCLEMPP